MIVSQNYVVLFGGYRTIIVRYVAKGVSHRYAGVKQSAKRRYGTVAPFWGSVGFPGFPEKVSHDMGYRSDSIATSRDIGPLRIRGLFILYLFWPHIWLTKTLIFFSLLFLLNKLISNQFREQKTQRKKHINRKFTGLSRDFCGDFVYVLFFPIRNDPFKKHINNFLAPTQSRDNPAPFVFVYVYVYVYVFSSSDNSVM